MDFQESQKVRSEAERRADARAAYLLALREMPEDMRELSVRAGCEFLMREVWRTAWLAGFRAATSGAVSGWATQKNIIQLTPMIFTFGANQPNHHSNHLMLPSNLKTVDCLRRNQIQPHGNPCLDMCVSRYAPRPGISRHQNHGPVVPGT